MGFTKPSHEWPSLNSVGHKIMKDMNVFKRTHREERGLAGVEQRQKEGSKDNQNAKYIHIKVSNII